MNRFFTVGLVLAGSIFHASSQSGFISHYDAIQSGRNGFGTSIKQVPDGYLVFSLGFSDDGLGRVRVFVWKVDDEGSFQHRYEHRFGDNKDYDIGLMGSVSELPGDEFQAALAEGWGISGETWLYTFNSNGDTIAREFILSYPYEQQTTHAIRQTRTLDDGSVLLCGFIVDPDILTQALLIKVNQERDTVWTRRFGNPGHSTIALGAEPYLDGGYLLTGYWDYGGPWNRSFLIRTDSSGLEIWRRNYGGIADQNGAVRIAADGGIITWSAYREPDWEFEWQQMMLTKWSPGGSILWQRKVIKDYQVGTTDMEILEDGSIIAAGTNWNRSVLIKFSAEGDSLWSREHTLFTGYHFLYDVQPTSDGGFVGTGATTGGFFTPGIQTNQVIWVVKTDSLGCVVPGCHTVGVEEYVMDLNEHLRVWPNPVASGAPLTVAFTPPPEFTPNGPLRVVVLDALGKQVHEELIAQGGHRERSEASLTALSTMLSPGLYHLHLTDNTRWLAGKSVVVE